MSIFPRPVETGTRFFPFSAVPRCKSPKERAQAIIENCAHPDYKQLLWDYLKLAGGKAQTPHAIQAALGMHAELAKSGDMKNTNWAEYAR